MPQVYRESAQLAQEPPVGLTTIGGGVPVASPPTRRRLRKGVGWPVRLEIALMTGPTMLVFVFFVILPIAVAAYYGFFSWQGYGPARAFVGLRNYVLIFQDGTFIDALQHNATIVVLSLVLQGPAAVLLALLLNRKMRGQTLVRVLVFTPYVISEVVVGTGWSLMLQGDGAVNSLLTRIGLGWFRNEWLSDPNIAIWTLMAILTWKYVGFAVILFLAALQGIPDELTEAAAIDGASYWQIQRRITLPLLGPTIRIWAFLSMIGALQLFDLVYIIWGQYIASTAGTSTMATYMVANGRIAGEYGYGNAVAVVLFFISLAAALVYQRFVLRRDTEGAITGGRI
jgi:raffinose/stachyose/melibiose transport system permease protein